MKFIIYKIYTKTNYAGTWRDPDDIHIKDLCYKISEKSAILFGKEYIKEHFFHKDAKLFKDEEGNFRATNFCSYGETLIIEKIEVS